MAAADFGVTAATIGLFNALFNIGKEAMKAHQDSKSLARDIAITHTHFAYEIDRFRTWKDVYKLQNATPGTKLDEALNITPTKVALVIQILHHICKLLLEPKVLDERYKFRKKGKETQPTTASGGRDNDLGLLLDSHDGSGGFAVLAKHIIDEHERNLSFFKKARWYVIDQPHFEKFVNQLKKLIDQLIDILPLSKSEARHIRMLQIADPAQPEKDLLFLAQDNRIDADYASAIMFRHIVKQSAEEDSGKLPQPTELDADLLDCSMDFNRLRLWELPGQRRISRYGDIDILVEFKIMSTHPKVQSKISQRMHWLTSLLEVKPKPRKFRVLDCKGFIEEDDMFALVFGLPSQPLSAPAISAIYDLRSLLPKEPERRYPTIADLSSRFRLAAALATAVSEIHATQWLHHNICSENVVFFSHGGHPDISQPWLSGFTYARIDREIEMSELPALLRDALYQHPEYRSYFGPRRIKYKRSYDLYSLGIVLLEIALWRTIDSYFKDRDSIPSKKTSRAILEGLVPRLIHLCGKKYHDATLWCLSTDGLGSANDEGELLNEAFVRNVVSVLSDLRA